MEWVVTTARTVDEARELALDQLGVVEDEAEMEILEEPRTGLFGRLRGEAKVRARVRPVQVRPKQDRRRGRRGTDRSSTPATAGVAADAPAASGSTADADVAVEAPDDGAATEGSPSKGSRRGGSRRGGRRSKAPDAQSADGGTDGANSSASVSPVRTTSRDAAHDSVTSTDEGTAMSDHEHAAATGADPDEVRTAAVEFVAGLTTAFGYDATVTSTIEDNEIDVQVAGDGLGLLIGPGGRTLLNIQDLTRVAAQRRLGDHETRLRVDVAGYREKRREALQRFAATVAEQVRSTGIARSLDPMPSADRKVLHDALSAIEGVTSRSEGEDPYRRIVVSPA